MEELLTKANILGGWVLYCLSSGMYDGCMYSLANINKLEKLSGTRIHPHQVATINRVAVAIGLCYFSGTFGGWERVLVLLSLALVFSFFHNGMYYCTRNRIDVPTYNFFSHSKTSTGFKMKLFGKTIQPFEMGPIYRTVLMILGITLLYFI